MTRDEVGNKIIEYESNGQIVKLSPNIIKQYLVSGDATNITDAEVVMFLKMCQYQRLNPFLREAYCIKYGNSPATMVVGKGTYEKRAARNKLYGGFQAGIIVLNAKHELQNRIGSMILDGETLVGGWARVYVKGYDVQVESSVSFDEYVGRKKSGEINEQWQKKPATMIRKVALVQALREAFPEDLEGLPYSAEEVDVDSSATSDTAPADLPPLELKDDGTATVNAAVSESREAPATDKATEEDPF